MKTGLENFRPRLRPGRVIPQGSRIIFETDNPYNQIVLPMALADLVLLCSGQFTVREIVEKIYRKQGAVPFKWILSAIHSFHQGGFFENGDDLTLSSHLDSWVAPRRSKWHLSWRFGQRIVTDQKSPVGFYALTLATLVLSILGLQHFPSAPVSLLKAWSSEISFWPALLSLFAFSSVVLTIRFILCGIQLLLLTGKAYNVSLRLSLWGVHLHVGDEANFSPENRLYTAMFHISQILSPWALVYASSYFLDQDNFTRLLITALIASGWELNPFFNTEGRKLLRHFLIPNDREVMSWHFEKSVLFNTMSPELKAQDRRFSVICSVWGALWLTMAMVVLHEFLIHFGGPILESLTHWSSNSWTHLISALAWIGCVFYVTRTALEKVFLNLIHPYLEPIKLRFQRLSREKQWSTSDIANVLENLPLFSHFHGQYMDEIIAGSEVLTFREGAQVVRQNEVSNDLYVLLEGSVEVIRSNEDETEEWVLELGPNSVLGESALADGSPSPSRVVTESEATLLKVPVHLLRKVAEEAQTIRQIEDFKNAILVNQFFAASPVFRSLNAEAVDFISSRGSLEYYNANQTVFYQGDRGDSLYMILRGSVDILVNGKKVKSLGQGNFFGEIALISNIARTATITTREPSVLFSISADSFWQILVQNMDLGIFIETISENRLKEDIELTATKPTGSDSN